MHARHLSEKNKKKRRKLTIVIPTLHDFPVLSFPPPPSLLTYRMLSPHFTPPGTNDERLYKQKHCLLRTNTNKQEEEEVFPPRLRRPPPVLAAREVLDPPQQPAHLGRGPLRRGVRVRHQRLALVPSRREAAARLAALLPVHRPVRRVVGHRPLARAACRAVRRLRSPWVIPIKSRRRFVCIRTIPPTLPVDQCRRRTSRGWRE